MVTQTEIGEVLKELRRESGMGQTEIAYRFGISVPALQEYERGRTAVKLSDLPKWADALSVPLESLTERLGIVMSVPSSTPAYLGPVRLVPIVATASAGAHGWTMTGEALPVGDAVKGQRLVAVLVSGDCLAPLLVDGDYAIVDQDVTRPANGDIVFVSGLENLLKRVERRNGAYVLLDNEGREYRPEDAKIEGIVVAIQRVLRRPTGAAEVAAYLNGERPAQKLKNRREPSETVRALREREASP